MFNENAMFTVTDFITKAERSYSTDYRSRDS